MVAIGDHAGLDNIVEAAIVAEAEAELRGEVVGVGDMEGDKLPPLSRRGKEGVDSGAATRPDVMPG